MGPKSLQRLSVDGAGKQSDNLSLVQCLCVFSDLPDASFNDGSNRSRKGIWTSCFGQIKPFSQPFTINAICSLICLCTLVAFVSNKMNLDQTAPLRAV